jgi:hypothetical protein
MFFFFYYHHPLPPPGGVDDDFEFDLEDIDLDVVENILYLPPPGEVVAVSHKFMKKLLSY